MFGSTDTSPFLWKNAQSVDFQAHMAKQTEKELLETYKDARFHSYKLSSSIVCWSIYQELGRRNGFQTTKDMLDILDMKEETEWVKRMEDKIRGSIK